MHLGLDLGTSSLRAGIFDDQFHPGPSASAPWEVVSPHPGWAEADPDDWEGALIWALRRLAAQVDLGRVTSVGTSAVFPALVCYDERERPVRPVILYADGRSEAEQDELRNRGLTDRFVALCGAAPSVGTTSFLSLMWIARHEPDSFRAIRRIGHANSFLGHLLTGELAIDPSNAVLNGLYDNASGSWSAELCEAAELPPELLPPLQPSAAVLGEVTPAASAQTGLPAGLPVALGAGDTICAGLGAGAWAPGDMFVSCGTTDSPCLCTDRFSPDARAYDLRHILEGRWLPCAPMSYTGGSLAWWRRLLAPEETDDAFAQRAEASPPGANGLVFTPYLLGERSPIHDPAARGTLHGLSADTDMPDIVRAVLEGVACGVRQNVELLEDVCGQRAVAVTLTGKPAQSAVWSQIRADVIGRPIRVLRYEDQSLLGAALCGAAAAGAVDLSPAGLPDLRRRLDHVLRPTREFLPREELRDLYDELHARYASIYPALRDLGSAASDQGELP